MATTIITSPDLFNLESLNTALQLPSGTTAERPGSPSTGEWRYNTTTNLIEYYDGAEWKELLSEDIPPIPSENFNVVLYTGNGSTQSITGVGFQPDFVWLKNRSLGGYAPRIFDSSRGATNRLQTSTTNANATEATSVTSFDADGFSVGSDPYVNNSGSEFVAWCWKVNGGTTVSNGDGDITSTVQANVSAGISIVQYTGNATSNQTIGHGLGAAPEIIFIKSTTDATVGWLVFAQPIGNTKYLVLNTNAAEASATAAWQDTTPSTSVFTIGTASFANNSGESYIAYCFAPKTGFSKFGSYTGNGSTTGPVVNIGFEPAFLLVKRTDGANSWAILDNKRSTSNPRDKELFANLNDAESTTEAANFFTNGFQIITTANVYNNNGSTYIYMAFAATSSTAPVLADSFANKLYTGDGGTQSITGLGFSPSFVWLKDRSSAYSHVLVDIIRGRASSILSDSTSAALISNAGNDFVSFDSDGFTVGPLQQVYTNANGDDYVAWNWKANPLPTINTNGSFQSTVSANQAAGFSIVQWTGAGGSSAQTVGHGLSAAPELIIVKKTSGTQDWYVFSVYANSGTDPANYFIKLNSSDAETLNTGSPPSIFAGTAPTASVFSVGSTLQESATYIAYCFHSVSGFSKFGTYTGNGSTQSITGVGFQPNWLMIKQTNSSNSWRMFDSARGLTPPQTLFANLNFAQDSESNTVSSFDSDGWTMGSQQAVNDNGDTYLYWAIKENPTPQPSAGYMSFLVVAGGGSGGSGYFNGYHSGGGGAGGLRTSYGSSSGGGSGSESDITLAAGTYTITVGAGGTAVASGVCSGKGNNGNDSVLATITSTGGGAGGDGSDCGSVSQGNTGGSGGGGGGNNAGGAGTANQGFSGGTGAQSGDVSIGAGGGGASAVGANGATNGGNGGNGLAVSITGSLLTYAGGGGGGAGGYSSGTPGTGGTGGGGNAGTSGSPNGSNGSTNTGGGGGGIYTSGSSAGNKTGGTGGSGVVILRLATSEYSGTTTGSPTVTTDGDYTILTYTGSGTYVHS